MFRHSDCAGMESDASTLWVMFGQKLATITELYLISTKPKKNMREPFESKLYVDCGSLIQED